jgi:succinate dehydrogenase/fumarate reductase flavoprotein subunit
MPDLSTDILIVGAGGAGMYAAVAAARRGASVLLLDKGQVGRGGATIMAQMTVAVALGEQEPDSVDLHLADTLQAGRGLCNEKLARLLCENGPARIREMAQWGTRWAQENGHIKQEMAPGHSVKRCCYVDFLNTGPAVAATLRRKVSEIPAIRRISNLAAVEILVRDGRAFGAIALDLIEGEFVAIEARAVILAAGGLTKLFQRNSASANMGGEAYALALWAGAELVDMEFVQFFPSVIWRRGWSAWTRSCGIRFATSSAASCSTGDSKSSSTATAARISASTTPPAISRPTRFSKKSKPAAARRTAGRISIFVIFPRPNCAAPSAP